MSAPRNSAPVVIAGGGIGGLACALGLATAGFRSIVLEQAQAFGEVGAGIQLAPNAWSALDALGVGELVKKEAVLIERLLMMDGLSGETVIEIPVDDRFRQRYGNPYAVTHRADIHGALLDACKARPDLIESADAEPGERISRRRAQGERRAGEPRAHCGVGSDRRGRLELRRARADRRRRRAADFGTRVLSRGAPRAGHAERPAVARSHSVGRTEYTHRALPAAWLDSYSMSSRPSCASRREAGTTRKRRRRRC